MRLRPTFPLLFMLAACGARTGTDDTPSATSPATCDALVLDGPHDVAPAPDARATFDGWVVVDDHALTAWTSSIIDTSGTTAQRIVTRIIDAHGVAVGDLRTVDERESVDWTFATLARGHGHAGVAAWGAGPGCRLVTLHDDGTPAGSPVLVDTDSCRDLVATEAGFVVTLGLPSYPARLARLDGGGHPLGASVALDDRARAERALEPDGTFLELDAPSGRPEARHVDAEQTPLDAPHALDLPGLGVASDVAITASDDGALVAWTVDPPGTGLLRVMPLDLDGVTSGPPLTVPAADPGDVLDVGVAALPDGDFVLVWSALVGPTRAHVQRLGPDTTPRGDPLVAPAAGLTGGPVRLRVLGTSVGALVALDVTPESFSTTPPALAVAIRCR